MKTKSLFKHCIILAFFMCNCIPVGCSDDSSNRNSSKGIIPNTNSSLFANQPYLLLPEDSVSDHLIDSILQLTQSYYFLGYETPTILQKTAININSIAIIYGLNTIQIPLPPSQEDYFKMLKESLAQSTLNNLNFSDELCAFIDAFFDNNSKKASTPIAILNQLCTLSMSAKMKAVRERDGERVKMFGAIYKQCNEAKKYADAFSKFFAAAGSLKDCIKIVIRAMQPLSTFTGAETGLQFILDNSNGLSNELKGAIQDILLMIRDINRTFLTNLRNSTSELTKIISDFGQKLYEDNKEQINKVVLNMIGSKNYKFLTEFGNARSFFRSVFEPIFPAENMLKQVQPAYSFTVLENGIHRAIFENMKTVKSLSDENKVKYIQSFKVLLLVEASGWEKMAAFFYSVKVIGKQYEENANTWHKYSGECLNSFNEITL